MKFRVWRKITRIEYKDIEAECEHEALKHHVDPKESFTITDDGLIQKYWTEETNQQAAANEKSV